MSTDAPRVGVVLTGGGARAAYQVGVLRALADLVPRGAPSPFKVICGTSAGAVNAVALAADAGNFRRAVLRLHSVWKNFHAGQVYRADAAGALKNSIGWIVTALIGGRGRVPIGLLDNEPLHRLLEARVEFSAIQRAIDRGDLLALAVTCSGYASGQSVSFFQGAASVQPWKRVRRVGVPTAIQVEHLLASSALPFIFPPVRIHGEYFGDGSMRQIAPLSPALRLGAERVLVVAVGRPRVGHQGPRPDERPLPPTLAQIAGHALNSIFLDSVEVDLERMRRINRTLSLIPEEVLARGGSYLRHVDFMVVSPSEDIDRIAMRYLDELPAMARLLFGRVGATERGGATLLSYLLFERGYCRELIALGYRDTMARKDNLLGFLGFDAGWSCDLPS